MLADRYANPDLQNLLLPNASFRPLPKADDREAWEALPEQVRRHQVAKAEKYLEYEWPALPATLYMEFARIGNRRNYERLHFARRTALATLVVGECIEREGRFLDDIINGIWFICEESFWGIPAHNNGPGEKKDSLPNLADPVIDLFAGETAGLMAWTHYLLEKQLNEVSPRIGARIRWEMKRRILDPYLNRDDFIWMGFASDRPVNNWNPWCNSNCLTAFLLLEDDKKRRVQAVDKALRSLDRFLDVYHDDGGCDEGTSYWSRAGGSLFDCLEQLHWATEGKIDVYDQPLIQEIGRFLYRAFISGDYFINFADGGARVQIDADLVYRYGKRIGDQRLMALGSSAHHAQAGRVTAEHSSLLRILPALFNYAEIDRATDQPPYVRDVWLDGIQVMAAREQADSDRGLYLAAKGGHNEESHNHNDVGHFIVYVDGRPVLIDVGVEVYTAKTFSDRRYEIWTMRSDYHNLPRINGFDQLPGREYRATDVVYQSDDELAEFSLDIANAYPKEASVTSWRRTVRLKRPHQSGANIEIVDDFTLGQPSADIELYLMTADEPEIGEGIIRLPLASVEFDGDALSATREQIAVEDERLKAVWGDAVHRITLKAQNPAARGRWTLRIHKRS